MLLLTIPITIGIELIAAKRGIAHSPAFGLLVISLLLAPFRLAVTVQVSSYSVDIPLVFGGIVILILIERRQIQDFYITRQGLLYAMLDGIALSIISFLLLNLLSNYLPVRYNLQSPNIISVQSISTALQIGIIEELLFRSLLLGYLRRLRFTPTNANLIQAMWFAVSHIRYLQNGDFGMMFVVISLGLLCGYMTLRRKNVTGAMILHIAVNMLFSYSN